MPYEGQQRRPQQQREQHEHPTQGRQEQRHESNGHSLQQQLDHLFGTSQGTSQGSEEQLFAGGGATGRSNTDIVDLTAPEEVWRSHSSPPTVTDASARPPQPAQPRATLRYVVPPRGAGAEPEKENATEKGGGGKGGRAGNNSAGNPKKRPRGLKEKDPNQVTLSQAFGGGGFDNGRARGDGDASEDSPARVLRFGRLARDASQPDVLSEMRAVSARASAMAVGALVQDTVCDRHYGFHSNLRPVDSGDAAAAKEAAKEWFASLPAGSPESPDGGWAAAIKKRLVGFGIVFLGAHCGGGGGNGDDCDDGGVSRESRPVYIFGADVDGKLAPDSPATTTLAGLLTSERGTPIVMHHAQTVVRWLVAAGVDVDVSRVDVLDPRVMAWLAAPDAAHEGGIEKVVAYFDKAAAGGHSACGVNVNAINAAAVTAGKGHDVQTVSAPGDALGRFRADLLAAASLTQRLRLEHLSHLPRVVRVEGQLAALLGQLEAVGVGFDAAYVRRGVGVLRARLRALEAKSEALLDGARINLASPQQVAEALYVRLGLPHPSSNAMLGAKTGQLTTKDDVLQRLATQGRHELPGVVLEHRATLRAVSMCVSYAALAVSGRLHCDWNNTRTATGRLSSSNPNLQAVGRGPVDGVEGFNLRGAFVAPPGRVLLAADYSQIELRMLAQLVRWHERRPLTLTAIFHPRACVLTTNPT